MIKASVREFDSPGAMSCQRNEKSSEDDALQHWGLRKTAFVSKSLKSVY